MPRKCSPRKWTPDIVANLIRMCEAGAFAMDAAAELGMLPNFYVYKVLKKAGYKPQGRRFPDETRAAVLAMVADRVPYTTIKAATGVDSGLISVWAQKAGIAAGTTATYARDESAFDVLDSQEKWWALGWIATDGYLHRSGNTVSVTVQRSDRKVLEKIRHVFGYEGPITDFLHRAQKGSSRLYSKLAVSSKRLYDRLEQLGFHQAKSHTIRPLCPPPEFAGAWWRGCIEGDGHLKMIKGNAAILAFFGNQFMVGAFKDWCEMIGCSMVAMRPHKSIFSARVMRLAHIQKVLHVLYDNATVWLDRKKAVAERICAAVRQSVDYHDLSSADLLAKRAEFGDWAQVGRFFGMKPSTVYGICRYRGLPK